MYDRVLAEPKGRNSGITTPQRGVFWVLFRVFGFSAPFSPWSITSSKNGKLTTPRRCKNVCRNELCRGMRFMRVFMNRRQSEGPITMAGNSRHAFNQDLEEISIVSSNATPSQVIYGCGPHTANGPRVVPGKIRYFKPKIVPKRSAPERPSIFSSTLFFGVGQIWAGNDTCVSERVILPPTWKKILTKCRSEDSNPGTFFWRRGGRG